MTCLTVLPRRISVTRAAGSQLNVQVSGALEKGLLKLCDREGNVLLSSPVKDNRAALTLDRLAGEPACVKLCRQDLLLDVAPL